MSILAEGKPKDGRTTFGVVFRLSVLERLRDLSVYEGRSIAELVNEAAEKYMEGYEAEHGPIPKRQRREQ